MRTRQSVLIGLVPDKSSLTLQTPRVHCVFTEVLRENCRQLTQTFPQDLHENTHGLKSALLCFTPQMSYSFPVALDNFILLSN